MVLVEPRLEHGAGDSNGSASSSTAHGLAEQRPRDHEPLDLARALVDLGDLRVAVVALGRELLRVAVAAEDLDRLAGLVARDRARRTASPARPRPCAAARRPSAAPRARPARAPPRSRSACRRASAGSRRAARSGRRTRGAPSRTPSPARARPGRSRPPARRCRSGRRRASAARSRMPLPGSPSRSAGVSSNDEVGGRGRVQPELLLLARDREAVGAGAHDEGARCRAVLFAREHEERRGVGAVGDPLLGAGDAAVGEPRAHRAGVRARARPRSARTRRAPRPPRAPGTYWRSRGRGSAACRRSCARRPSRRRRRRPRDSSSSTST